MTHTILSALSLFLGAIALYAALFLHEDEEGAIQNRLETWWSQLDDLQSLAVSRQVMFLQKMARFTSEILDRLYGKKYFSYQAFMVSLCFSTASICAGGFVVLAWETLFVVHDYLMFLLSASVTLGAAAYFFSKGYGRRPYDDGIKRLAFIVWIIVLINWQQDLTQYGMYQFSSSAYFGLFLEYFVAFLMIMVSFWCDMIFVAITRSALKVCSRMKHGISILLIILCNTILAFVLTIGPLLLRFETTQKGTWRSIAWPIGLSNSVDAGIACLYVILAAIMLLHLLIWPIIKRPLYTLQRIGIAKRSRLFATMGVGLVSYSGISVAPIFKNIVDVLLK